MEKSKLLKTEQPAAANMIMEQLPQEIILSILSRLPLTSLVQSMLVCKTWRSLIQHPLLVSYHFSHMADVANEGPISFIFQRHRHSSTPYQLFFIDFADIIHSQGRVMVKKLPNSPVSTSTYLVGSCNGLVCMRNARGIHIYNPFTRVSLELPKLSCYLSAGLGLIAFGFDRTANKYKVIRLVSGRGNPDVDGAAASSLSWQTKVHVVTVGEPAWRTVGTLPYDLSLPIPKAMVNGRIHWLSKTTPGSLIISFDLATEKFQEVPKPDCDSCGLDDKSCFGYLMVLRGCLSAAAYHGNEQLEIWVMKEYGVKESWIKEFSIGIYLPQNYFLRFRNGRARFPISFVRPLCVMENGEILLEYRNRVIVVYDPQHGTFKELAFPEMRYWDKVVVHVGSMNWIDTPINL